MKRIPFRIIIVLSTAILCTVIIINTIGSWSFYTSNRASLRVNEHFKKYQAAVAKDELSQGPDGRERLPASAVLLQEDLLGNMDHKDYVMKSDNYTVNNPKKQNMEPNVHHELSEHHSNMDRELLNSQSKLHSHPTIYKKDSVKKDVLKVQTQRFSNWLQILEDDGVVRDCITGNEIYSYDSKPFVPLKSSGLKDRFMEELESRKESFLNVYDSRAWGHSWDLHHQGLNASGRGSTLDWTQEVIATLHLTINAVKQKFNKTRVSILDVPCGDMAWMSRFLKTRNDVQYTGMDIVPELITHHKKMFKSQSQWTFINADVLSHAVGQYDIIVCRMMLQHLYDYDAVQVLKQFSESGSSFVLLTTFSCHDYNQQLVIDNENPGRFRLLNLQIDPFSLRPPLCVLRDGPPDVIKAWEHYMGLWSLPLTSFKDCDIKNFKANLIPCQLYACL